ncbi:hypothetical protein BW33_02530 [Pseudomonas sp. RIT288]|nr:hypothetical protein BW33_02530 [Pseudomonas sp. RIT288]
MSKPLQNSTSWSDTLKARKEHLTGLLKTFRSGPGKNNQLQALAIKAIDAEMANIENELNRQK